MTILGKEFLRGFNEEIIVKGVFALCIAILIPILTYVLLLRTPKRCPQCHRIMLEELIDEKYFCICRKCGHLEEMKKWFQ
jgi:hypothetical protein